MSTRALFREDAYQTRCDATVRAIDEQGIHLDQNVFYPLGGGQAGDAGMLKLADGTCISIAHTRKAKFEGATSDDVVHVPAAGQDSLLQKLAVGDKVSAEIDWEQRYKRMRLHTASHLICAVLPYPVDGCSITTEYARLDLATVELIEREAVEAKLAELIGGSHAVRTEWITDDEMVACPELVRTMSVKPADGPRPRSAAAHQRRRSAAVRQHACTQYRRNRRAADCEAGEEKRTHAAAGAGDLA